MNKEVNLFTSPAYILSKIWGDVCSAVSFAVENSKPRYPFKIVGEKLNGTQGKTILYYKVSSKRHIFEISATELCNSKNLISNFHPLDVRVICFIAGVEQILDLPETKRAENFKEFKDRLFNDSK